MTLIEKAKDFAQRAHASINQKRKYSGEPYHLHCERVAEILADVKQNEIVIAASLLHDVIEDVAPINNQFNEESILSEFGPDVLHLVLEVTNVSTLQDGNRATRKEIDRKHLAKASPAGKTIKLADIIDNLIDIRTNDPGFARIFEKEIELDLPFLREGHEKLFYRLIKLLNSKTK